MSEQDREIAIDAVTVPACMAEAVHGYAWARDTVGEAGAAVYRLHGPVRPTLYLKHGGAGVADDIVDEMVRLRWLGQHLPVPRVLHFVSAPEEAWLLMTAIPGRTAYQCLEAEDPARRLDTVTALAAHLRAIHSLPVETCPFNSQLPLRMAHAQRRLEAGQVDASDFGEEHEGWTPAQVWREMTALLPLAPDPVVTHGDYSLDNILLEDGRVTGCIDVGRAGIADRYQDLAILWNCLGEFNGDLQKHLFEAYGITHIDGRKISLHLSLDEFF